MSKQQTPYTKNDLVSFVKKEMNRIPWIYLWNPTERVNRMTLTTTKSLYLLNDPWNPIPQKLLAYDNAPELWDLMFQTEIELRIREILDIALSRMNTTYVNKWSTLEGSWKESGTLSFPIQREDIGRTYAEIRINLTDPENIFPVKWAICLPNQVPHEMTRPVTAHVVKSRFIAEDLPKRLEKYMMDIAGITESLRELALRPCIALLTTEKFDLSHIMKLYQADDRPEFIFTDFGLSIIGMSWTFIIRKFFSSEEVRGMSDNRFSADPEITIDWDYERNPDHTYIYLWMTAYIQYNGKLLRVLINYTNSVRNSNPINSIDVEYLTEEKAEELKDAIQLASLKASMLKGMIDNGLYHHGLLSSEESYREDAIGIFSSILHTAKRTCEPEDFSPAQVVLLKVLMELPSDTLTDTSVIWGHYPIINGEDVRVLELSVDPRNGVFDLDYIKKPLEESSLKEESQVKYQMSTAGEDLVNFAHRLVKYIRVECAEKYPWFLLDFYNHPTDVDYANLKIWGSHNVQILGAKLKSLEAPEDRDDWKGAAVDSISRILSQEEPTTEVGKQIRKADIMELIASIWTNTMKDYSRLGGEELDVAWTLRKDTPNKIYFTLMQNYRTARLTIDITKREPDISVNVFRKEDPEETTQMHEDIVKFAQALVEYLKQIPTQYPWMCPTYIYHPTPESEATLAQLRVLPESESQSVPYWKYLAAIELHNLVHGQLPAVVLKRRVMGNVQYMWKNMIREFAGKNHIISDIDGVWDAMAPDKISFRIKSKDTTETINLIVDFVLPTPHITTRVSRFTDID